LDKNFLEYNFNRRRNATDVYFLLSIAFAVKAKLLMHTWVPALAMEHRRE
jgi:hypothetical protein